jgi:hypothetical protein
MDKYRFEEWRMRMRCGKWNTNLTSNQ